MNDELPHSLSSGGIARKEAIFQSLVLAQRRRVVRRRAGRFGAAVAAVALVGLVSWASVRPATPAPGPAVTQIDEPSPNPGPPGPSSADSPASRIQIVRNEPGIVARLAAAPSAGTAKRIGDRELDDALIRAGRTPGSVRSAGKFFLASDIAKAKRPAPGSG